MKSSLPSVSVVVPAYNEADYIEPCIKSLLHQQIKPLEIIVVDNNSTDATAQLAANFPLVQVVKEQQQGIVHARNTGFDLAKGDIIARCDADSILPPSWVKHLTSAFVRYADIAAITGPVSFYDLPKQIVQMKPVLKQMHAVLYFKGSKAMLGHEVLYGSNMALRRSIWQQIRKDVCLDETKMHEDTDLAIHVNQAGGKILFDPTLTASISMRRAKNSVPDLVSYLARWPKTRLLHPPITRSKSVDD